MPTYSKHASPRNYQLDLLDWHRERELRASHPAARKIAEGYRIEIAEAQQ